VSNETQKRRIKGERRGGEKTPGGVEMGTVGFCAREEKVWKQHDALNVGLQPVGLEML